MQIFLAADHRGFQLKEFLKGFLSEAGYRIEDCGAAVLTPDDDYVDFANAAAEKVSQNPGEDRAILICGSGHGMDMVANKFRGVRAALCFNIGVARQSREHEDANVLVLPADWLDHHVAADIARTWLEVSFSNEERHVRRLAEIAGIEAQNFK